MNEVNPYEIRRFDNKNMARDGRPERSLSLAMSCGTAEDMGDGIIALVQDEGAVIVTVSDLRAVLREFD